MAIFDRNYDRDFGHRGTGFRGDDRGLGDRVEGGVRRGWNRLAHGVRDAMDRDDDRGYDRGYGFRGGAYGGTAYDRDLNTGGFTHGSNWGYGAGTGWGRGAYDRDLGTGRGMGMMGGTTWGRDRDDDLGTFRGTTGYDRDFGVREVGTGYDREMKSRWQTDYGDPFGDRTSHTPIRMTRGEFHGRENRGMGMDYDRDFGTGRMGLTGGEYDRDLRERGWSAGSSLGYDRDLMNRGGMRGMGYDPYDSDDVRGRSGTWGLSRNRGYDRGWF